MLKYGLCTCAHFCSVYNPLIPSFTEFIDGQLRHTFYCSYSQGKRLWHNHNFKFEVEDVAEERFGDVTTFTQMSLNSLFPICANAIMVAMGATCATPMFRAEEVLPSNKKVFWDDLKVGGHWICSLYCIYFRVLS